MIPGALRRSALGGIRAVSGLAFALCIATPGIAQESRTANSPEQIVPNPAPRAQHGLADLSLEELMSIDMRNYTGVVGGHTHLKGEWMIGYRYMFMKMDGMRDGRGSQSKSKVLSKFPVTPLRMTMQMHMLEVMQAPSDDLTLMLMIPYHLRSMDHVTRMGAKFTTRSEGLGDVSLTGLYTILRDGDQEVHVGLGLGLPTGSIGARGTTPAGPDRKLPYPMQVGSGTFDLRPTVTYTGESETFGWGAQARSQLRLGENRDDYRLGNRYGLMAWGEVEVGDSFSVTARLDGQLWNNVHGADPELNPLIVPTADPNRQGGKRLDALLGLHLLGQEGILEGQRLDFEIGVPIYQDLEGPQMETTLLLNVAWRWTF